MEDSEAGSDADEEKDVEEVEAVEAKAPTPEPSAPPSPERAPPRRRIREPVDLGTALGPDWDPEAPAKVETFDALKRVFDEADEDSDGELGVDDFVKAFRHLDPELRDAREALRRARSEARSDSYADAGSANAAGDAGRRDENDDEEKQEDASLFVDPALEAAVDARMRHLFAIMDTNAGDTVDWDEFSTHVMLTAKEMRDKARALQPPSRYAPPHESQRVVFDKQTRHNDLVTKITRVSRVDQYATVSRDGSVRAWSLDDTKEKRATLRKKVNVGVGFLNDAAELPITGRLAVACFDRSLRVFDPKAWTETGAFRALKDAPLCVAGWAGGKRMAPGARDVDYVAVGDVGGHVHFLRVIDTTDGEKAERPGVGVRFEKPWSARDVHKRAWVTCLCYVASENAIATGGSDGYAALLDVNGREGGGHVRRRFTKNAHVKGVNAIAWSEERKTLYTAGDDRVVKLWNPLSEGPVAQLAGHEHPVTSLLCVDEEDQLVTLDLGKTFKVWDVRTRKCLQTFTDDQEYHPENAVGSLCFDPKRRSLVTASVQPKVWALETNVRGNVDAHAAAVVSVNFSKAFQRACSADEDGVVCVWDLRDGGRVFRFNADGEAAVDAPVGDDDDAVTAHADAASGGGAAGDALKAPTAAAVISARLDGRGRRIVVGGGDGSVRCWNIANGALCKELFKEGEDPRARAAEKAASSAAAALGKGSEQKVASSSADRPETARVTGVCTIGDYPDVRFAAAGWSREMTLWDDSHDASTETPRRVVRGHQSDILFCVCNDESTVLATGDFAGNVFVWSDMGERRLKLEPPPLPPDRDVSGDVDADASGSDHEPTADRAAECAAWLATRRGEHEHRGTGLPHTFLFVGHADGHVRAWDVKDGRLACDFFAGHKPGESVVSVAIDPEGSRLVTGDSVGRVRLWDVKSAVDEMHRASRGLRELSTDPTLKTLIRRDDVECLGYWQAHESRTCVQALEFFRFEPFGEEVHGLFFASGGEDAAAHLWSFEGQHIGQFGPDVWQLDDPKTWRSAELPVGSDTAARRAAEARDAERRAAKAARRAARLARDAEAVPPDGDEEETATPPAETREDGRDIDDDDENAAGDETNADRSISDVPATPGPGSGLVSSSSGTVVPDGPDGPDVTSEIIPSSSSPSDGTTATSSPTEPSPEPSPTSTIDSATLPDPFPSPPGYKPVRPVEDRARWTRDVKNAFESSGTYREIVALEEKKHPLRDASLPELRARSEKLSRKKPAWHTRVYIPEGDEHINKPRSRGRPYTSLHHLIHISDVAAIPKRPTTRAGRFKYGSPIKDTPTASPEKQKNATKTKGS